VRAVSATRSRDVRFNQLEESTGARIRYRKVSEQTGDEVPNEKIVKGYEVSPGQYVTVTDDEMRALAPKASRTIDIEDFVDLDRIDPIYFEQPYYLAPDPNSVKPYRLLVDAMTDLRKVAIGRIVMRSKERLVAIRPYDGLLCLETMRYEDEVVPVADVIPPLEDESAPAERELEMARQLVASLEADFEPDKYHDTYREELLALIDKKAAGEEIVERPAAEEPGKVLDLMAALEASLARTKAGGEADAAPAPARARRAPAKKAATKQAPAKKKAAPAKAASKKAPAKTTRAKKSA
jgi:DNA end-binding protein Ku